MPMPSEKTISASAAAKCSDTRRAKSPCESGSSVRRSYTPAAFLVVVDDADRLHERVADGRPDEAEAALQEVLAHRLCVLEAPDIGVETAEFLLHGEKRFCVAHGALDLQSVANDALVTHQGENFLF